ncbi:MAG: hypothetical protein ACXQTW_04695 [Candidatus Methanospirareceae archaeon]
MVDGFPYRTLRRAVKRLEAKEINPKVISETYPIELFMASFREAIGFEECVREAMKELGLISEMSRKVKPFEEFPEGLKLLLLRKGFEIFLNRLMTLAFWVREGYRGSTTLNKQRLIEAILKAANLPPDRACELLSEVVERSKKRKRLVKALLLLGMKGYLFWSQNYGLTLAEEPEPEPEPSETYEPCLAFEVSPSF